MSRFFQRSDITPYTPGEQVQGYLKLNTNESPFPPSPCVCAALTEETCGTLNRYPDPDASELRCALAHRYGVQPEQVFVGNGSDEVLAFAFYAYGTYGISAPDLSYGFYPVFADFFQLPFRRIALRSDLTMDCAAFCKEKQTVVFANPNAPTGLYLQKEAVREIVAAERNRMVMIDEAYIDFGGESAASMVKEFDNLLVIGTFSKSRNLAGGRIGFAIGAAPLIADLNALKYSFNPYNLNSLSIRCAIAALEDEAYFRQCTQEIIRLRVWSADCLKKRGFVCTDSKANFLFVRSERVGGEELYRRLREKGVLVRYLGDERIQNYVRITIGTQEQMEQLFTKIDEVFMEELPCEVQKSTEKQQKHRSN